MINAATSSSMRPAKRRLGSYLLPETIDTSSLVDLVVSSGRKTVDERQLALLGSKNSSGVNIYSAGRIDLINRKVVAIVGSRAASIEGQRRSARLARELAQAGVVVSSGLAKGIDTAALTTAIKTGGDVMAVIGTPLEKAYPAENKRLQEEIYSNHLLLTPFQNGQRVFPSNFPQRNRVMALLSDATVIVEASDTSGTLHQAAECQRQGRWLFLLKSLADNPDIKWPQKFLDHNKTAIVESTEDILLRLNDVSSLDM